MFIVLKEGRSEIRHYDFETSREKYMAHYYFRAEISKEKY
jgi:hypothetical protein